MSYLAKKSSSFCLRIALGFVLLAAVSSRAAQAADVLLNEVLFDEDPASAEVLRQHEWLEIHNSSAASANLSGWVVADRDGRLGSAARALPAASLPPGAYLVVHIATGINDLDFSDGCGAYYTGDSPGTDLFSDTMDEAALYDPAAIVDFVAWNRGDSGYLPGVAHGNAVVAGQWPSGEFLNTARLSHHPREKVRVVRPGTSIGRDKDSKDTDRREDWDATGGRDAVDITPCRRNLDLLSLTTIPLPPPAPKTWTVMLYINGNNDLEEFAYGDLKEIEKAGGSDANVNVVVMVDGMNMLQQVNIDANNNLVPVPGTLGRTWRFQVGAEADNRFVRMRTPGGADPFLGERNLGDPAELAGFIAWAKANFPAQKYALILWDHGLGWKGIGWDDTFAGVREPSDALFMGELKAGLAGQTFELLGFDACLMAMIEVAYQVQPFSSYLVASEETEDGNGWPYDLWLPALKANPGWNGAQLGTRIVDDFSAYYSAPATQDSKHTLATIDQTQLPNLAGITSAFAVDLRAGVDDFKIPEDPTDNVQLSIGGDAAFAERFGDDNFMDLHDFADKICADPAIPACYKVQCPVLLPLSARLGPVVIAEKHGPDHDPGAHGLSIHMPLLRTEEYPPVGDVDVYDYPAFSREANGNTLQALYAPNNDALPLLARDPESEIGGFGNIPLAAPPIWPLTPTPDFDFPADTQWDEFLLRYYHPAADNTITKIVTPEGQEVPFPRPPDPDCGNPVDEVTIGPGWTVHFSGAGSSDAETNNLLPVHWMWDFDAATKGCILCTAPYELNPGQPANAANDDMNADHDANKAPLDDEKQADAVKTSRTYPAPGDYVVTLNAWDDNHTFNFHDTNPSALYVHPQTDSHISIVHVVPFEIDYFSETSAVVELSGPFGMERVRLTGPSTVHVDIGTGGESEESDDNSMDLVRTEMVQLDLSGSSPLLGSIALKLRDPSKDPFQSSLGEIVETSNAVPGRLDVPPFAPTGTASSFFDVFFEVTVNTPFGPLVLHNRIPKRMQGVIRHKPPTTGDYYESPDTIPLYTEDNQPSAYQVVASRHVARPEDVPPSCHVSIIPGSGADVTVGDSGTGLGTIVVTKKQNATVDVPGFPLGSNGPVLVKARKVTAGMPSIVELKITDVSGNAVVCDPVLTLQVRDNGQPVSERFDQLPAAEHKVTVVNGSPGLKNLHITVNGRLFVIAGLKDGEQRTLDVSSAMQPGNGNVIVLTAHGKSGGSAEVAIHD